MPSRAKANGKSNGVANGSAKHGTPKAAAPPSPDKETPKQKSPVFPASPVLHGLKVGCKRASALPPMSNSKMHRRSSGEPIDLPHLRTKARLILDDGTTVTGYSFGAETSVSGEVVFNTAMVGYPEALTDPSYRGQLLCCTYPLIGNYGVPPDTLDDVGLPVYFESRQIHISALLVQEYSSDSVHWNQVNSLGQWLKDNNIPGLCGIDTRALTKRVREHGAMLGRIVFDGVDEKTVKQFDPNNVNLVAQARHRPAAPHRRPLPGPCPPSEAHQKPRNL